MVKRSTVGRRPEKNNTSLEHKFKEKMKGSMIDPSHSKKLRFQLCAQAPRGLPIQAGGFVIPYFDLAGKPTTFFRFRYLEEPPLNGFAALTDHKMLRYGQLPETVNELYLPPVVDWRSVAKDKTMPILITEGELKAACGSAHTPYPVIGLGGVWCWKSNKARAPMLPQFKEFEWKGRPVYIVFDSDAKTNPMVMQAENALAIALTNLGAEPHVARLPGSGTDKVGLDDYLLVHPVSDLEELLEQTEPWRAAKELHELNEEVVYVQDPGFVVRTDTLQKMAPHAFINHHYATRTFWEENTTSKGKTTLVKKVAPKEWISWPGRAEVPRMTYAPGADRITEHGALNVWKGWATTPAPGDITLWRQLLDHLFHGDAAAIQWFERWLAWPIQHPGDKLYTAVLMWGLKHGTGKSFIGYSMKQIYGDNWVEIKDRHLDAEHNEWCENKQFCMGDELMIGDKRETSNRLKNLITQESLRINIKYVPSYVVPDRLNYYFTSNHPDGFFLEDDDRRMFIWEVVGGGLSDAFYSQYERWIRRDLWPHATGPSALFHHLLHLPLGDFNPRARAPMTDAKRDMMSNGRSDLADWVARLRTAPASVLKMGQQPLNYRLWRADDLLKLYDPDQRSRVTPNGMARELRRAGFVRMNGGEPIRTKTDGQVRLWAVLDVPAHVDRTAQNAAKYYDEERAAMTKRSKIR